MFRSLFTKYFTAFMLIIGASFLILSLILYQMVDDYSRDAKSSIVERTAKTISETISTSFQDSSTTDFNQYVYFNRMQIEVLTAALSDYNEDVFIIITDPSGAVLVADSRMPAINQNIPLEIISAVRYEDNHQLSGDLGGALDGEHLICAMKISDKDDNFVGAVFAYSHTENIEAFVDTMLKTIIMSSLWVLLAALVAVYFISDRIIAPLKNMSKAAKSFAQGKFDVRVPVTGRDEVAELATAFNNMATDMSHLEDARRTFLSSVSHDMRTPMTTISGFIDGIIDGAIPPEKHEYYLDIIRTEIRRLSRLVGSLLDITRIQAGERKFTKSAFDICEMARLILISFEQKLTEKNLDVEFDCKKDKMIVYADHDAIYQILYNICDNAVKFTKEGGKYRIRLIDDEKKVYVSVFNEGIGIPPEELPFVFERFYKSDRSRGLDKSGVGLGLYIAKTIIDAHEEEIWVKSEYGENCEFVFTLPYMPEIIVKD